MSGWPGYDLTRFVEWWLKTHPPEDPQLPFDEEHERARVADQKRDADREERLIGD